MPTGTIGGDRVCSGCGFNLIGQRVTREPHYGLLITICPECGQAASMQSYPVMSRWVNRWRALLGVGWVMALMLVFAFQVVTLVTGSSGLAADIGLPLAREIGRAYDDYAVAKGLPSNVTAWGANNRDAYYQWVVVDRGWLESDGQAILRDADIRGMIFSGTTLLRLIPEVLLCFVMGWFWSVVLLGSTRVRVVLVPVLIAAVSGFIILGYDRLTMRSNQSTEIVRAYLHPEAFVLILGVCAPFVLLGIWQGRALTRAVLMMTLPPGLRAPFAWLWLRDGLSPPRPGVW